jgi:hypothetical protein
MANSLNRGWWQDWGETNQVEECLGLIPPVPSIPEDTPIIDTKKYQPIIDDLLIFDSNKIDIYFIS